MERERERERERKRGREKRYLKCFMSPQVDDSEASGIE
jgi:hypothetical protein